MADPIKYTVRELSLIGNTLYPAGAVVEYDGLPAENLMPMDERGEAKRKEYEVSNAARIARMRDHFSDANGGVGDPQAFAAAFRKELSEANAKAADSQASLVAALQESTADAARSQAELVNALQASAEANAAATKQQAQALPEMIAAAVAAAIAQVFPNGTAKKAVTPPQDDIA